MGKIHITPDKGGEIDKLTGQIEKLNHWGVGPGQYENLYLPLCKERDQLKFYEELGSIKEYLMSESGINWMPSTSDLSGEYSEKWRMIISNQLRDTMLGEFESEVKVLKLTIGSLVSGRVSGLEKEIELRRANLEKRDPSDLMYFAICAASDIKRLRKNTLLLIQPDQLDSDFDNIRLRVKAADKSAAFLRANLATASVSVSDKESNALIEISIIKAIDKLKDDYCKKDLAVTLLKADFDCQSLWYLYKDIARCNVNRFAHEVISLSRHAVACLHPDIFVLPTDNSIIIRQDNNKTILLPGYALRVANSKM